MTTGRFSWILILLGFCIALLCGIFVISYADQVKSSKQTLDRRIDEIQFELSQALVNRDWIEVARLSSNLKAPGFFARGIFYEGRLVFSHPAEASLPFCRPSYIRTLELYGIKLAIYKACDSFVSQSKQVLKSPIFLALGLFVLSIASLGAIVPLFKYRKGLLNVIAALETEPLSITTKQENVVNDEISERLITLVNQFSQRQLNLQIQLSELKKNTAMAQMARQVAHDIRSPLSALNSISHGMRANHSKYSQLVEQVIERINQIANQLLLQLQNDEKMASLPQSLDTLVDEKLIEYQHFSKLTINLKNEVKSPVNAPISDKDFKCILSNLINNAVEALENCDGVVEIEARVVENSIHIGIRDNGIGISPEVMKKIGLRGFTYGKENGNGLGLHSAQTLIQAAGGRFELLSNLAKGTLVNLEFPLENLPSFKKINL